MADDTQDQAGLGNFFSGRKANRQFQTMKARMEVDTKGMRDLNREFKEFADVLSKARKEMAGLIKEGKELKNLSGIASGFRGGSGSGRTSAGGVQTNPDYISPVSYTHLRAHET